MFPNQSQLPHKRLQKFSGIQTSHSRPEAAWNQIPQRHGLASDVSLPHQGAILFTTPQSITQTSECSDPHGRMPTSAPVDHFKVELRQRPKSAFPRWSMTKRQHLIENYGHLQEDFEHLQAWGFTFLFAPGFSGSIAASILWQTWSEAGQLYQSPFPRRWNCVKSRLAAEWHQKALPTGKERIGISQLVSSSYPQKSHTIDLAYLLLSCAWPPRRHQVAISKVYATLMWPWQLSWIPCCQELAWPKSSGRFRSLTSVHASPLWWPFLSWSHFSWCRIASAVAEQLIFMSKPTILTPL